MKIEKTVSLAHFRVHELSEDLRHLLGLANEAANQAYAPHSEFKVGAVALLDDGSFISGSNQENAAYPSGLCAERTLLFHLGHTQPNRRIVKMAITARSSKYAMPPILSPCGACLQVMSEQVQRQNADFEIWMMAGADEVFQASGLSDLLPFRFLLGS